MCPPAQFFTLVATQLKRSINILLWKHRWTILCLIRINYLPFYRSLLSCASRSLQQSSVQYVAVGLQHLPRILGIIGWVICKFYSSMVWSRETTQKFLDLTVIKLEKQQTMNLNVLVSKSGSLFILFHLLIIMGFSHLLRFWPNS